MGTHVGVDGCVCSCRLVHVEGRGQHWVLFLQVPSTFYLRQSGIGLELCHLEQASWSGSF